jgi:16S rRNA (guanine1516-N2)-methyltransferase
MSKIAILNSHAIDRNIIHNLNIPLIDSDRLNEYELILEYINEQWYLRHVDKKKKKMFGVMNINFTDGAILHRFLYGGHNRSVVSALGLKAKKNISILDATAGWGNDAFLFSSLGCRVTLYEKNPLVFFILNQAIEYGKRNSSDPALCDTLKRMTCFQHDSIQIMSGVTEDFDVVYLDPMFESTNKSAKVKKNMQFLQIFEKQSEVNDSELLSSALEIPCSRVVVKRFIHAPQISHVETPSYSVKGKTIRYDVYIIKK